MLQTLCSAVCYPEVASSIIRGRGLCIWATYLLMHSKSFWYLEAKTATASILLNFMVTAGAGEELSEGPSLARWLLILAFGGTKAGLLFMGGLLLYGLGLLTAGWRGDRERERKEEAVFLLWPDLRSHNVIPTVLYWSCVLSPFSRDPMDCSPPGSSVCGIPQARILEWVAISFSSGSSRPRNQTCVSYISCLGRWILCHQCYLGSPFYCLEPCN